MIPRLSSKKNGMGKSFKGAAMYYLHDKNAQTSERVGEIETVNIGTQNPHLAWRIQAATAMNQNELKSMAGVKATGRKLQRPVFTYSLSWHPDETPTVDHMMETAKDSLKTLGLDKHQVLIVQHTDEPHAHVHLLVNRVCPETGRAVDLKHPKRVLSDWAKEYEREHGIYCEQRFKNERERENEKEQRAKEQEQQRLKERLQALEKQQEAQLNALTQHQNRFTARVMMAIDFTGSFKRRQEKERQAYEHLQANERLKIEQAIKDTQIKQPKCPPEQQKTFKRAAEIKSDPLKEKVMEQQRQQAANDEVSSQQKQKWIEYPAEMSGFQSSFGEQAKSEPLRKEGEKLRTDQRRNRDRGGPGLER